MDKLGIIFWYICIGFIYCLLLNGIEIYSLDTVVLYISPYYTRFVLLLTLVYLIVDCGLPYLIKKLKNFISVYKNND